MSEPTRPTETSRPEPASPGPARTKLNILLPIALSVAALALFLIAFWPDSHSGKKSHARRGHAVERGGSPVGGSDNGDLEDLGNSPVTQGGGSPVGGGKSQARPKSKGGGWWYQDEGNTASKSDGDQWWYQDKKSAAKPRKDVEAAGRDREREADASGKSGPDNNWWHD